MQDRRRAGHCKIAEEPLIAFADGTRAPIVDAEDLLRCRPTLPSSCRRRAGGRRLALGPCRVPRGTGRCPIWRLGAFGPQLGVLEKLPDPHHPDDVGATSRSQRRCAEAPRACSTRLGMHFQASPCRCSGARKPSCPACSARVLLEIAMEDWQGDKGTDEARSIPLVSTVARLAAVVSKLTSDHSGAE